ncbi:MAG: hypothetical protein PHQ89_05030 [Bacilli bacterium]|nr:hypothetical protein [Bacilli bacterium]
MILNLKAMLVSFVALYKFTSYAKNGNKELTYISKVKLMTKVLEGRNNFKKWGLNFIVKEILKGETAGLNNWI